MNNDQVVQKAHSEEYFEAYRDFWWNLDFLKLMSQRLNLNEAQSVLDVGCGIGHWEQLLSQVLSEIANFTGIDLEESSIEKACERAQQQDANHRFQYKVGNATAIPYENESFDLVTCQTLLIHLKEPKKCLLEMLRVLKPNGILLLAEPNNFANSAIGSTLSQEMSINEIMDQLRFDLTIQRGKKALGLGFNSEGDLIPGYLNELGAREIKVYISDKATPFLNPYITIEQQIHIQQWKEWTERQFLGWDKEEMKKYFVAAGGTDEDFNHLWSTRYIHFVNTVKGFETGTFNTAGGGIHYLISAKK